MTVKRKTGSLPWVTAWVGFLWIFTTFITARSDRLEILDEDILLAVLKKTAEYCQKLDNAVLSFVCMEEIEERIDLSRDRKTAYSVPSNPFQGSVRRYRTARTKFKNTFLYDYQLIRKDKEAQEQRLLLEENGKEIKQENAPLKTHIFHHEKIIFGPIGLLSEYWQYYHQYRWVKEDTWKGSRVYIIEAVPKGTQSENFLFGNIWVDAQDYSILKIEWDQNAVENFPILKTRAEKYEAELKVTFVSEFLIEKNGIRFPNRFFIREAYIDKRGRRFVRSETNVVYRDYKFFTVETNVKYKK